MKKIITATLLSAGLIMGSTSVAFATETTSASTAPVTLATYKVKLATYNTALVAYDSATVTIKAQVVAFGVANQTYKTAYESTLLNYKAVLKANAPATTPAQYAVLLAAYNTALTA